MTLLIVVRYCYFIISLWSRIRVMLYLCIQKKKKNPSLAMLIRQKKARLEQEFHCVFFHIMGRCKESCIEDKDFLNTGECKQARDDQHLDISDRC